MKQQPTQTEKTVKLELTMTEAKFAVTALGGIKTRADELINKIVMQANSQLKKPESNGGIPVGISEEWDDKILNVFEDIWGANPDSLEFDFERENAVVVGLKFAGEPAEKLIEECEKLVDGTEVTLTVSKETKGAVILVFAAPRGVKKDSAPGISESWNEKIMGLFSDLDQMKDVDYDFSEEGKVEVLCQLDRQNLGTRKIEEDALELLKHTNVIGTVTTLDGGKTLFTFTVDDTLRPDGTLKETKSDEQAEEDLKSES